MRACWWAINQIRREHASIRGLARQLGTTWNTVWLAIRPLLVTMADDETRFAGVKRLGVDEHVWHHVSEVPIADGGRGPKQLTGMVDLTPDADGKPRARLLDLVPGRSGRAYSHWLEDRGDGSGTVSRSPPWTRSTGTRTPSTTSSRTPRRSWTPVTWSRCAMRRCVYGWR
jgi:transposase